MVKKVYFKGCGGSIRLISQKHSNATNVRGMGMGSVLLDGGLGGQSSYASVDDYLNTTNKLVGSVIKGRGAKQPLKNIIPRLEALSAIKARKAKKDQNIKFSI
jgi:hypothetical protein